MTDVAILLPEDDAEASYRPGHVSITDEMKLRITPELVRSILDAGYNLDYVDAATLERLGKVPYGIVVLPPTERIPLKTARLLAKYAASSGHVIAIGALPKLAPGLQNAAESHEVAQTMQRLFTKTTAVQLASLTGLGEALHRALSPDLSATLRPDPAKAGNDLNAGLGFVHRRLDSAEASDLYYVVNGSSETLSTVLSFRAKHRLAREFSLDSGKEITRLKGARPITVTLAPYESRVFVLSDTAPVSAGRSAVQEVDLRAKPLPSLVGGWTIQFPESSPVPLAQLVSWNCLPGRKFFSGEAIYRRKLNMDARFSDGNGIVLDFGEGRATVDTRKPEAAGIHALLDPPIREVSIVYVNGREAGSLWHPPYRLPVGGLLKPGANELEIHVYNTAINLLAGQPRPDYSSLTATYGKRFEPQDMDQLVSLPSGLLSIPVLRIQ